MSKLAEEWAESGGRVVAPSDVPAYAERVSALIRESMARRALTPVKADLMLDAARVMLLRMSEAAHGDPAWAVPGCLCR